MTLLTERYRAAYAALGLPLKPAHGLKEKDLLGLPFPAALREYYLLAGRETQLNTAFNRLLSPADCFMDDGRLVFMEENQGVVFWGVKTDAGDDPVVEQAANEEPLDWFSELTCCSDFLVVTLYWQASFGGGLKYSAVAYADADFHAVLDEKTQFIGQIDALRAYGLDGCALAFLEMDGEWHLYGGFKTRKAQSATEKLLGVEFEEL